MYLTSLTPITEFTTVSQAICQSALDHGSELALCQRNTGLLEISYPDLPERVNQVAKILKAQGVVPGERVILLSENSIEWVLSLLAIFHCQATAVPLDPTLPIRDLQALITRTDACVLLVSAKSLTKLPVDVLCSYQVLNLNQDWRFCAGSLIPQDIQTRPLQDADPNLALIIFSSGTSGQPKGVMLTHQHLLRKMAATRKTTIHTKMAHQRWLLVLPLHHIATLVSTLNLLANGHCCQLTNIQSSQQLWDNFAHYQPMFTLLVPQLLKVIGLEAQQQAQKQRQLQQFQWLTRLNLICRGGVKLNLGKWVFRNLHQKLGGQLKAVFSGGAKLDADLHKMLLGLGLNVLEGYGLSETTGGITNILPEKFRLGAVGQADDDAELMIHQPDADGIGEIWVRSPYVMQGYFRDEAATTASLQNGWFHTGDLGRIDNQGVLYITGRCKEVIVTAGGKKATPEQIESHYQALANVKELAVVGVPRPEGTEDEIHAAVVLLNDASLEPVKSEIRQRSAELPYHLQIQQVHLVENLPRTATLKVQRIKLKQQLQNGQHSKAVTYPIVAPQTERQILIAKLFAEVLVLPAEKIGIHTSFFELGGHSLLATQLVSRLRETFEADVVLQTLFESPTVADLDTVLANKPKPRLTIPPIEAIERDQTSLPLSYAQERMWFLSQLEGAAATYNIPGAVRIEGFLDIPALQQAIDELVCRHESLRTTFPIINGCAVQYIAPTLQIPIEVLESSAFTGTLSDWLTEVAQEPFDLKTGPLLRIKLLTLAADDAIVVSVTMHHIISDGWSMAIFIRELGRIYEAFRQGQPTPLPRQVIQYVDYTLWQRQWLQGEILEAQLNYWQEKLANLPALLDLPTDHPRPAVQTFRGRTYHITLPLGLTEQVQSLAQQQGVTLFMTLLAAFQLLLYRYSHQSDIVVGSPIANRQKAELESLIGFFANTLVLRTQFEESDTVSDLFAKVRRMTLGAYSHQDVPFERVVEALQPERTLAHTPLFQVMFVLQNAPMAPLELSGVTLTSLTPDTVTAKFDVTLSMMETEQGLMASWEYNSDLFEADTIARMAVHFEQLLSAMVEDISQPVATLPMLTDAERYQLLVEWNDTAVEYPQDQCIHKLFEAQVELTPDAVAVVFEDQQLTYGELNARANQLAHYLQDLGVGPEVLVGLCVERSIEMVVGLLGILKAGGAYVPLDPSYPTARLEFMLTDAQVKILLTQQTLQEKIESFEPEGYLICLDSDWSTIALKAKHNLLSEVNVENLAYVIYTSGSTGIPKGVQGLHQGVINRLQWMWNMYPFQPAEVCCQKTSLSFVDSVWELFGGLLQGILTLVIPNEVVKDVYSLIRLLHSRKVSRIVLVPSLLRSILDTGIELEKELPHLKYWSTSGEALDVSLYRQLCSALPGSLLLNLYGSSEVSADVTCYETYFSNSNSSEIANVAGKPQISSIGRPIHNTQTYILDNFLQIVPIGVPGELHIGGAGLARGYLNRPDLTAETFIDNPFGSGRLYKTGDLGRYLPDGNIEFLGRIDHQVKIRGFRIELGEIESVLNRHDQVQQSVVITREDTPGNKQLVAYVVSSSGELDIARVRRHLKHALPDYMVPSVIVALETMPLTPNGKVDRNALPASIHELRLANDVTLQQTERQRLIAELFSQVLSLPVEQIGIHTSFFELGGHSLLATQLVARLRETFEVEVPLRTLFESPTIADLETAINTICAADSVPVVITTDQQTVPKLANLIPLQSQGERLPLFCIHPYAGVVFPYLELAQYLGKTQPVYGLQSLGFNPGETPLTEIEAMATAYIDAIKTIQPQGPYRITGWSMGAMIAFEMAKQLQQSGETVEPLILIDAPAPSVSSIRQVITGGQFLLGQLLPDVWPYVSGYIKLQWQTKPPTSSSLTNRSQVLPKLSRRIARLSSLVGSTRPLASICLANAQALSNYTPDFYDGKITLLRTQDPLLAKLSQEHTLGWQPFSSQTVEVNFVPGKHMTLLRAPHVDQLAEVLKTCLW